MAEEKNDQAKAAEQFAKAVEKARKAGLSVDASSSYVDDDGVSRDTRH